MRVEIFTRVRAELPPPPRTEPFPSPQVYRPILCPFCGAARPRLVTAKADTRYYRCRACDLEGDGGTRFRVPVRPGDPALLRLAEEESDPA